MNIYEQAVANQLASYNFCEGCPFVQEVLETAHQIDNPSPIRSDASELERSILLNSPPVLLNVQLVRAGMLAAMNRPKECQGSVAKDHSKLPDWIAEKVTSSSTSAAICGIEDQHYLGMHAPTDLEL